MNEFAPENKSESPGILRLFVGFLALLILYAFLKNAFLDPWLDRYEGGDFTIYYVAANRIVDAESPYPMEAIERYEGEGKNPIWGEYPYPPMLARLLVPLTRFSILAAKWIYILSMLSLFFGLLFVLFRMYRPLLGFADLLPLWAALFGWAPFIYSIRLGQCELLAMPFLALAWILLLMGERDQTRRNWLEVGAGVAMGFAAMVRLTPVLMIPVFLVTFRLRVASSFVLGSLIALIVSGPESSWEFFTEVLPIMSDVSGMSEVPAFHVLILRSLSALFGTDVNHPSESLRLVAALGSGVLYTTVLGTLFWRRFRFSTLDLFLIACYLPPLFAGKNPHHYTLALFPIMVGSLLVVREALGWEEPLLRLRMILWVLILLPALHYWPIANGFIDWIAEIGPLSRNSLFILGNLVAFGLVIYILDRKKCGHWEKMEACPLQD